VLRHRLVEGGDELRLAGHVAGHPRGGEALATELGGGGAGPLPTHPLVTAVPLDGDPRLLDHRFLLFLSEHSAYALLAGPDGRLFHSSDVPLVDALVSRLQTLYDLQPI